MNWREAVSSATDSESFGALIARIRREERSSREQTVSAVWEVAQTGGVHEKRMLANLLGGALEGRTSGIALLWLLAETTESTDEVLWLNTLSAIRRRIVNDDLEDFLQADVPSFLARGFEVPALNVKFVSLSTLALFDGAFGFRDLGKAQAASIREKLRELPGAEMSTLEKEMSADLRDRLNSAGLRRYATCAYAHLEDLLKEETSLTDAQREFARLVRLRLDAQLRASSGNAVLTIRTEDTNTGRALLERLLDTFYLCRATIASSIRGALHEQWIEAPAASLARHAICSNDDVTQLTFERLLAVSELSAKGNVANELESLPGQHARTVVAILEIVLEHRAHLSFSYCDPTNFTIQAGSIRTFDSASRTTHETLRTASNAAFQRLEVYSDDIPQANTLSSVLDAVSAAAKTEDVAIDDITTINVERQVDYYVQGARILGLLTRSRRVTDLSRGWNRKSNRDRLRAARTGFEQSLVADAWRSWASAESLWTIDPGTATEFLTDRARGISGTTIPRRASTLRRWFLELQKS